MGIVLQRFQQETGWLLVVKLRGEKEEREMEKSEITQGRMDLKEEII